MRERKEYDFSRAFLAFSCWNNRSFDEGRIIAIKGDRELIDAHGVCFRKKGLMSLFSAINWNFQLVCNEE
jgi:hypothetical protein